MGRRARTIAVIKNKDSGGKAMTGQDLSAALTDKGRKSV